MNHIQIGDLGEGWAVDYLKRHGYRIIEQKYKTRLGEIDIIAKNKDTIIFIEVKTRRNLNYGVPAAAVNIRKQQKIINTALCYLNYTNSNDCICRFDVIEIICHPNGTRDINHIINAFTK